MSLEETTNIEQEFAPHLLQFLRNELYPALVSQVKNPPPSLRKRIAKPEPNLRSHFLKVKMEPTRTQKIRVIMTPNCEVVVSKLQALNNQPPQPYSDSSQDTLHDSMEVENDTESACDMLSLKCTEEIEEIEASSVTGKVNPRQTEEIEEMSSSSSQEIEEMEDKSSGSQEIEGEERSSSESTTPMCYSEQEFPVYFNKRNDVLPNYDWFDDVGQETILPALPLDSFSDSFSCNLSRKSTETFFLTPNRNVGRDKEQTCGLEEEPFLDETGSLLMEWSLLE
eukprot:TRINITY_DN857_c0_g1_i3.p4 TRINITY_DN857_c0_g1~~TRINITY_DN857_c0_g1_i3.p4  ORF type:complete len:281 (+),score=68.17 TRINITY_DN857_c0_g1_i3:1625-2467(+)